MLDINYSLGLNVLSPCSGMDKQKPLQLRFSGLNTTCHYRENRNYSGFFAFIAGQLEKRKLKCFLKYLGFFFFFCFYLSVLSASNMGQQTQPFNYWGVWGGLLFCFVLSFLSAY